MKTELLVPDPHAATAAGPAGFRVPGVVLGEILGRGAFGAVFRGQHQTLDIPVAVKLIEGAFAPQQALELALREARLMARLDHPNLVRIFDAGRLAGGMFLVLELMDGGSLERIHLLNEETLRNVARQAFSGLQELHEARIIHRDIKPANLLRRRADRRIKLGDLGIAMHQETQHGKNLSAGTLPFMAPELWSGAPEYSIQSDLYALGLSLACLALEQDPFPTDSLPSLLAWVQSPSRPEIARQRLDLSPDFCALLARLMAPSPEQRPASAAEALAELQSFPALRQGGAHREPIQEQRVVGPWRIGECAWLSVNWESYTAHHRTSGAPARWAHAREGGATASATEAIARGGALATTLDHPGFLPVLDWGELDGRPWVVTAPQGQSLLELQASRQPLDELTALSFGINLADALAYLHERGLVYQAVAPGSVFVRQDARAVQLGWPWFVVPAHTPVATQNQQSNRAGIPEHMAPEAFSASGSIEPAVDLWGLGEVLCWMLTGQPAAEPASYELAAILSSKLLPLRPLRERNPLVTAPSAQIVEALLDREPTRRPAAAEIARELRRILLHLGVLPRSLGAPTAPHGRPPST